MGKGFRETGFRFQHVTGEGPQFGVKDSEFGIKMQGFRITGIELWDKRFQV